VIFLSVLATLKQSSGFSMTQGPAISVNRLGAFKDFQRPAMFSTGTS